MNKLKIFISSKVNPEFEGLDGKFTIGNLRDYIKTEIEGEKFLNEPIFEIIMNEEGFAATFTEDAFNTCLTQVSKADIVIILYSGDAGWAPVSKADSNGICHEEYMIAADEHPGMTYGINLTGYFTTSTYTKDQEKRNESFQSDVDSLYRFKEYSTAKTIKTLKAYILKLVKTYIKESSNRAFKAKKESDASNTIFGKTLDWSKLKYEERVKELYKVSESSIKGLDFLKNIDTLYHVIPDNMSVSDAKNYVKRPFLYEHNSIKTTTVSGIIHIISIYGTATENQVKNLVGYPDVTVIKTPFGFYLWEQVTHIQIFFLLNCKNPNTIKTRGQQISIWLKSSREESKVQQRSLARFSILKAINDSHSMLGLK